MELIAGFGTFGGAAISTAGRNSHTRLKGELPLGLGGL